MVLLVALRLSLGCHFLYEGVWKIKNPDFSAESFLLQAKGPATPLFHAMVPDIDGRKRLEIEEVASTEALIDRWEEIRDDAEAAITKPYRDRRARYEEKRKTQPEGKLSEDDQETVRSLSRRISGLTRAFARPSQSILWQHEDKLEAFLDENEPAMLAAMDGDDWKPSADEAKRWLSGVNAIQTEYLEALKDLVKEDTDSLALLAAFVETVPPVVDEAANAELVADGRLLDPKGEEVLCITEAIRADKFYKPWDDLRQKMVGRYNLSGEQQAQAEEIYRRYKESVQTVLAENQADIAVYFASLDRFEKQRADGNQGAAHQVERNWDRQQELRAEVNAWLNGLAATDEGYRKALTGLLTPDQEAVGKLPTRWTQMDLINFAVTYGLTAIGLCLFLGLFTRPAALGGGCFMLFVVLTQPAWPTIYPHDPPVVGHALLINKDFVEMIALFMLATTAVGRWGGLDYFVENTILRLWRSRKNQKN